MCYAHLTQEQRYQIQELRQAKTRVCRIARKLNVHRSTVYRELRRGTEAKAVYLAEPAQCAAQRRRRRCAGNARRKPAALWRRIYRMIRRDWSPEQLHGRAQLLGQPTISVPAIYAGVERERLAGGSVCRHLRYLPKRRQRLGDPKSWLNRSAKRPSIHDRPAEAASRQRAGHWEGDTMRGHARNNLQLVALVERKARFLVAKLPRLGSCASKRTARSIIEALRSLPKRSITFDNGSEFAEYDHIASQLKCPVYFADAHEPNQRATCENTIGLIRQYLPKRCDLSKVTNAQIKRIVRRLNNRPRKCLGYLTPSEVLFNKPPVALRT